MSSRALTILGSTVSSARRRARHVAVAALLATLGLVGVTGFAPAPAYADWVRAEQWQLQALNARTAWGISSGSRVIVAVLDSGVDATHPDLVGQVLPGADMVDGSTDGRHDFVGHGTTVAALIAGRNDDRDGVAGVAPKAKILPVRVLDENNRYDDAATVAKGLRWAVDHGARVVNMSLGGGTRSADLADAIDYAYAHDVVVVACTGNVTRDGPTQVWYPAREPGVVAVAGLTDAAGTGGDARDDTLWAGALTGPQTVLTAPAADLLGARPGGYWKVQGTSFAAPLVSASAALIRSRWPTMSAANVINRLISTARDLGAPGRDNQYGFGEVDPLSALTATVPTVAANPLAPPVEQRLGPIETKVGASPGGGGPTGSDLPQAAAAQEATGLDPGRSPWNLVGPSVALAALLLAGTVLLRRRDQQD
ncbi:MAG TPA: type VII secretion-associated serine protease mycosin [Micromonosporaceae bacterium]